MAKRASESNVLESAITLVEATLALNILEQHKRDVINGMLWKITEARGKYKTRFRSTSAINAPKGSKLQHEHVTPRKQLIEAIIREPQRARELLTSAIGCVVTKEEHRALARIDREQPGLQGWERYVKAGITVIDSDDQPAARNL